MNSWVYLGLWKSVYQRIRYFREMYPFSCMLKDALLLPLEIAGWRKSIRFIRNLTFAISHRCNFRCSMCYFQNELNDSKLLNFSLFKKAIDDAEAYHPCIILSGGEPFTHPYILDMVHYAKIHNLPVQIVTNGALLNSDLIDRLVALKLNYINFSLLGNEEIHNKITGRSNSYHNMLANLQYIATHRGKTKVGLSYTLTPSNIDMALHAIEIANKLHLDGIRFQHLNYLTAKEAAAHTCSMVRFFSHDAGPNEITNVNLSEHMAEEVIRLRHSIAAKTNISIQWAPTLSEQEIHDWYTPKFKTRRKCLFVWRGLVIDADGMVYPCSKIYLPLGDLRVQGLIQILNGARANIFREHIRKRLLPGCSRCCKL